jgi:prostaglandin-endoperoxide synthase 2
MLERALDLLLRGLAKVAAHWPWLAGKLSDFAVNSSVNVCRHRPHPWSTVSDYVSWRSLTDRSFSARHLPAYGPATLSVDRDPSPSALIGMFQRPTGQQRFCEKSTCLFPTFAQYLTDGFIRTRMPHDGEPEDLRRQNTSNHEIDLCPLYGRTLAQTDCLRLKSEATGQKGRLKSIMLGDEEYPPFLYPGGGGAPDPQFAPLDEPLGQSSITDPDQRARIFALGGDRANSSPQVAMMNTLLLREHNRLAGQIERAYPDWDDERVFQTARSTVIAVFIKIVVEEYINHISPAPIRILADPAVAWNAPWNKPNWITTEFSLLYRWHSLVPDVLTWNGKTYPVGSIIMDNRPLLDAGLARGFADMSAQRAGRLGAFNTDDALLPIEERAIRQGRICRLAPYADYRAYVSLPRPRDFEDVSTNPKVVAFLKKVYQRPGDIEFYVGLFAEDTVRNSPLPELILRMVAVDAFSQALTNPLLSEHVFREDAFSTPGWDAIHTTSRLRDVVARNVPGGLGDVPIGMTQAGWTRRS